MQSAPYRILNRFDVMKYLVIPKSQHPETRAHQRCRASCIPLHVLSMLSSVHLDYKHRFQANKVKNVVSARMLPAEFETVHLPSAQAMP